jgi:acyl carrier protein
MNTDSAEARRIVAEQVFGRMDASQLDDAAALDDLGVDSFRFLVIVMAIEAALGRKVYSMSQLARIKTIGDLVAPLEGDT